MHKDKLIPPWMLSYRNTMDDFMDEIKHKNERVTVRAYDPAIAQQPTRNPSWADSHIAAETEAERQFIASAKLLAALPKKQKRFSWAGVIALLAVAAVVMWLAYSFVEGW